MDFNKYTLSSQYSNEINSPLILKTRREELGLTQQQVATGARLQLIQYQRLERGERTIESSSMRTALSICAVLKLDPFLFFPDAEEMNSFVDLLKRNAPLMREDQIRRLLARACHLINDKMGTTYSSDNVKIAFCTANNIHEEYLRFTSQYGFSTEDARQDSLSFIAEAFVGQSDCDDANHIDGILIRLDPPADLDSPESYLHILVHELCHIFCVTHEISTAGYHGQRFYDLYCSAVPTNAAERATDGTMNAGYAIWREFIAVIMADIIDQQPSRHLDELKDYLLMLAQDMKVGNPTAKSCLDHYLSFIFNSWEGREAESWDELEFLLHHFGLPFKNIVELVFEKLHDGAAYEITPDFIADLGSAYMITAIQNTPPSEIMEFATRFGYRFQE